MQQGCFLEQHGDQWLLFPGFALLRCSDLLSLIPPGGNVAEGSDLPGDLRLLGRAAAAGGGHPGSGPLLGLYESQPAPAELLLELLEAAFHWPWLQEGGCREELPKESKAGIFIESSSRVVQPPPAGLCLC